MKKKSVVVIIINILLFISIIFIINFVVYYNVVSISAKNKSVYHIFKEYMSFLKTDIGADFLLKTYGFRPVENKDSDKGGIVLFACSYAYGFGLNENQTLSYKLGKLTDRPIYNRAMSGLGIQHMLYQLQNEDFYKIVPKPEYIIYVYFSGHLSRITTPVAIDNPCCYSVFYKKNKSKLILKKSSFFNKFLIKHYFMNYFYTNMFFRLHKLYSAKENLLFDYIIESKKAAEEHWGKDVKFVVLSYSNLNEKINEKIKSNGIFLIDREDFKINVTDKNYQISETDVHPNEKAWDVIVPVIIEKLNLNADNLI